MTCTYPRLLPRIALGFVIAGAFAVPSATAVERRVAFVVGNSEYQSVPQLPNPKNDAAAVAKALKKSGFEVVTALDLDRVQFDRAFEKFIRSMDGADLSVFYYSGHGIQVDGVNRMVPTDAKLQSPPDLEVETVSVETILSYMQTGSKVQLVYLDSCRNNPFPNQSYLVGPDKTAAAAGVGLAPLESKLGSLVAYSTQPGAVAVDGTGERSPFTEAMVKHSFRLGVDVQTALTKVADDVWQATAERQRPWSFNALAEPIYLAKPAITIAAVEPDAAPDSGIQIGSAPVQEEQTPKPADSTSVQVAALLQETFSKPQRVPIGVGQVVMLNEFPIIRAATGTRIEILKAPAQGVMYLDGKAVTEGDVISQDQLRSVSYEPSLGSEGTIQDIELKVAQDGSSEPAEISGQIQSFLVPCDDEAGEPLDLQGVGKGRLPNEINPEPAVAACTAAVNEFPAVARYKYQLGRAHLAGKDTAKSLAFFNAAAEAGHTRAFYQLGYMAQRGLGRDQNLTEANRLFKVGSDLGDPFAMLSYGRNLARGRGVDKNVPEGINLLNRAVELGHTYAMNALGAMYYYGENLKANPARGIRFYEASLARGDIYAMHNLGLAYLDGKGVKKDITTALALMKKASDGGHPNAPTSIGAMYFKGNGVKKDTAKAMTWYQLGAERGDFWAASNLAWIHSQGPKDQRSADKAVMYSSLAVALDAYNANPKEKAALAKLPAAAKKTAVKRLIAEVGSDNIETAANLDDTLVLLSRKAWQMRNPRLDLF